MTAARVLADLGLAAVRRRLDGPFVCWLAVRALDPVGAGRVETAILRRLFSRGALNRALRMSFFRGVGRGRVYCVSAAQVAAVLGLQQIRTASFAPPLSALLVRAAVRRGRLVFGAVAALRRGKPVSVSAIAEMAGVSRRTVFSWLRTTRWPRRRRLALQPARITPGTFRWLAAVQPGPFSIVRRRGRLRLARRLPNALSQTWPAESRKWLVRRINAALPAPLATRVLHSTPADRHPVQAQIYATEGNLAFSPGADPAPPNCQREGEDLGHLLAGMVRP